MKPKIQLTIKSVMFLCITMMIATYAAAQIQVIHSDHGTLGAQHPEEPCVPPGYYAQLNEEIATNVARLAAEGKLMSLMGGGPPQKYEWPLTNETHFLGNDYFFIQNYVDHDTATGSISEYMCGTRSYDLPNGYDHRGTDICIGPYWWNMMDDMKVRVIAAAPGQIVARSDGNFDRNCGMGGAPVNSIAIQHGDGTIAFYFHMKNGSVTPKLVGETVQTGEYLGYVGSSGSSTNPHLHFEIQDSLGNWIDPWQGPCNDDIIQSLWNDQKPYPNSGIMSILTMWDVPSAPPCPGPETVPYSNHFAQGAFIRVEVHLRDLIPGTTRLTRIYNPAGNVIVSNLDTINNFAAGAWYSLSFNLPNNTPLGTYKIQVDYEGKIAAHYFTVGCPGAYNLSGPKSGYKGYITGSSITSTQVFSGSSSNNIWYEAATFIQANPGFRATRGCSFRARIDACAENSTFARVETDAGSDFSLVAIPSVVTDHTKLRMELSQSGPVSITVYDLTGRIVTSLVNDQHITNGTHEFELSVAEFSPGVYICTALSGESKAQCKIVVQKK